MTSKIVVNNIESDSGINTVTIIGDVSVGSSITATDITATHHGSGADLTNLPAANLTGTLPAIDGSNLTGVGASFGNSSVNTSGIITATSFVPTTGQLSHRNLIINGDMNVAQRATTTTTQTYSYQCIDRFRTGTSGLDEGATIAQADVSSGTTPYTSGFRKCLKVTNGNQTSGAGAADYIQIDYTVEAQDIAQSGWNYKSSSSNITFSFWIKSSVAQAFPYAFQSKDGTAQVFNINTPTLTADTWTKVTKTIPGNSNIQFDNDNGSGLKIMFFPYLGTNFTTNGLAEDTWSTFTTAKYGAGATTTTWYTTNDATFEVTGLQLEVGSVATPFEHRSRTDEFARCQRYYQQYVNISAVGYVPDNSNRSYSHGFFFPVEMRSAPTMSITNTGSSNGQYCGDGDTNRYISSVLSQGSKTTHMSVSFNLSGDLSNFRGAYLHGTGNTTYQTTYKIDAEL